MCLVIFEVGFEGVAMAVWKLKLRSRPMLVVRGKDVTVTHLLFALFFNVSTLIGMLPSQKQKRKLHPKRPCPCCGATLLEKTIERHASGNHILTHIKVTHAQKRARFSGNSSRDLLGDLSGEDELECLDSDLESDLESTHSDAMPEEGQSGLDLHEPLPDIDPAQPNTADTAQMTRGSDADLEDLEETVRNTWQRARVEDYKSDEEDNDFEDAPRRPQTNTGDSDLESESEWEGMRIPDGLGTDDFVDEELQRIIAEFGVCSFLIY